MAARGSEQTRETPIAEWIAAAVGACLLVGTLATLAYEAVNSTSSPPDLRVEVASIAATSGGYRVEIRVHNAGTETAAAVQVMGEVMSAGQTVESSEAAIDYVAGGATATAGLLFEQDPRTANLVIRAVGYRDP